MPKSTSRFEHPRPIHLLSVHSGAARSPVVRVSDFHVTDHRVVLSLFWRMGGHLGRGRESRGLGRDARPHVRGAGTEGGDSSSIAAAKRNIVTAVKSSKEWVQLFEMYMQFETDEESNPLSETKIIGDMNESGRSLEVLFEACENAKVLTRLAQDE